MELALVLGEKDRQTDSLQVCARAEKMHNVLQYNGYRDDKPLPLSSFLFTPEGLSSLHCMASWAGAKERKLDMILTGYQKLEGKLDSDL